MKMESQRGEKEEKKCNENVAMERGTKFFFCFTGKLRIFFLISNFLSIDLVHANKLKCKLNRCFKEMMNVCGMIEIGGSLFWWELR